MHLRFLFQIPFFALSTFSHVFLLATLYFVENINSNFDNEIRRIARLRESGMKFHQRVHEFYTDLKNIGWYGDCADKKQEILGKFWSSLDFMDYSSDIEKDKAFLRSARDLLDRMIDDIHRSRVWNNVGAVASGLAALVSPIAIVNLAVGGASLVLSSTLKEREEKYSQLYRRSGELLNSV